MGLLGLATEARKGCYKTVTIPDVRRTTSSDNGHNSAIDKDKTKRKKISQGNSAFVSKVRNGLHPTRPDTEAPYQNRGNSPGERP